MRELDALRKLRADLPVAGVEETAAARAALLAAVAADEAGRAPAHSRRRLRAALAAGCCAALLALFLVATPPGRALSEQVGKLVGLDGERPGDYVPAAPPAYLTKFSILSEPIAFDEIPVDQRAMLVSELPRSARGAFRTGRVTLPDGTVVKALGNRNVICFLAHSPGIQGRGGTCTSLRWAVLHGSLVTRVCADGPGSRTAVLTGIVPDGVSVLGIDRHANGVISGSVPVHTNAFSLTIGPPGVVLHGRGAPGAGRIELKAPLGKLTRHCG